MVGNITISNILLDKIIENKFLTLLEFVFKTKTYIETFPNNYVRPRKN